LARTGAAARSPVVFFTDDGQQVEVPMSSIYFDDGVIGSTLLPDDEKLLALLTHEAGLGQIVAGSAPIPPAFTVEAAQAGAYGNRIVVTTAPGADEGTVDVTVSATDHYSFVNVDDLKGLLGTDHEDGTQPGILKVADSPAGATEPIVGDVVEDPAGTWALKGADPAADAVTLGARTPGAPFEAGKVTVRVEAQDTFTLVVSWTKTVPKVVPDDFAKQAFTDGFTFLVTFHGPFHLPRAGTVSLTGGSDPSDPVRATATVMAAD
jgi:hypothetical protein